MFTCLPGCHNQTTRTSRSQKQFQIAALRVLLNKACQTLKVTPEDFEIFNETNFHRFHVYLFKLSSTQLNDETDSKSLINTLLLHLINQHHWLNTFNNQYDTDAEKTLKRSD